MILSGGVDERDVGSNFDTNHIEYACCYLNQNIQINNEMSIVLFCFFMTRQDIPPLFN